MIGKTISHYQILAQLGAGGMGVVYKAEDTKLKRLVALKFLPSELTRDEQAKERFIHEAQAASALDHPNICTIHEINATEDGQMFLVMAYYEGETLKEKMDSGRLLVDSAIDIAIQIGQGLAKAHEHGIVHRDVKPANVIVTKEGVVKIVDFGLALLVNRPRLTKTGSTVGTMAYMSPEQARGEQVDQRTDIWALGVVLYEMLTGELPFKGEYEHAVMYSILNEEPKSIASLRTDVPAELEQVVKKMILKKPAERYRRVDEVIMDLRRNGGASEPPEIRNSANRKLPPFALPGIVAAGVALSVGGYFLFNVFKGEKIEQANAAANALAVMSFENIPDPEDTDHAAEMLLNLLITSLTETKGLEVISRERLYDIQRELGQIETKNMITSSATKIARRAGAKIMLLGSIVQNQPTMAVTSRLIEVESGRILKSRRLTGFSSAQIFSLVDSLSTLLRKDLNLVTTSDVEVKPVAEVTTNSPEAYRAYVEGVELNKKILPSEALAPLMRAIELDSAFAMAYFALSRANELLQDNAGRRRALQKAWELSNKASEKERLRIQADYDSFIEDNPSAAADLLEEFLRKYPHEQSAYGQLSGIYYEGLLEYAKGVQTITRGLKNDSLSKNAWLVLSYYNLGLNRRNEALEAADHYLKLAPGEWNSYDTMGDVYHTLGENDSALYWFQKASSFGVDHPVLKLGFDALLRQKYASAEAHFLRLGSTSNESQRAAAEYGYACVPMHQGKLKQAQSQLQAMLSTHESQNLPASILDDEYSTLALLAYEMGNYPAMREYAQKRSVVLRKDPADKIYGRDLLAWAWFKSGDHQKSDQIMVELKNEAGGELSLRRVQYEYISALLAYEAQSYEAAAEQFQKSLGSLAPTHAPQFHYALSLLRTGRHSEAIAELERVTRWYPNGVTVLSISGAFLPTASYWPIASVKAHYSLAVAYEQKGEKEKAKTAYEKFLALWKEADPNLPELADAKRRSMELLRTE